jgi:hypothetical protein
MSLVFFARSDGVVPRHVLHDADQADISALELSQRIDQHLLVEITKFRPSACRTSRSPTAAGDEIDHPDRGQIGNASTDVAALEEELAAMVTVVERQSVSSP